MKSFGETLSALLEKHKIFQKDISPWSSVHSVTISRLASDKLPPTQDSVDRIVGAYAFPDEDVIALYRSAGLVPATLIERFVEDEAFAIEWMIASKKNGKA